MYSCIFRWKERVLFNSFNRHSYFFVFYLCLIIDESALTCCQQFGSKPVLQRWYSCEQCNRIWKTSTSNPNLNSASSSEPPSGEVKGSVRICEPCIQRCHSGHKGVRFIKESATSCLCQQVCSLPEHTGGVACRACVISERQKEITKLANNLRLEQKR